MGLKLVISCFLSIQMNSVNLIGPPHGEGDMQKREQMCFDSLVVPPAEEFQRFLFKSQSKWDKRNVL